MEQDRYVADERGVESRVEVFPFVADRLKAHLAAHGVEVHDLDVRVNEADMSKVELIVWADRDVRRQLAAYKKRMA